MQIIDAYKSKLRALTFSADGSHLATAAGAGRTATLWPLTGGKRFRLQGAYGGPHSLAFAPRGTALVAGFYLGLRLWPDPVATPAAMRTIKGSCGTFRHDGAVLAYHESNRIRFLDLARNEAARLPIDFTTPLRLTAWSPTGTDLALFQMRYPGHPSIWLLRLSDSQPRGPLDLRDSYQGLAFSPDGRTLAVAAGKVVQRWEVATLTPLPSLRGHERILNALAYLPDGRLVTCSNDGTARTWEDERCVEVKDWQLGPLTALAVAGDGMRAVVGSRAGTLLIWDLD